MSLTLRPRASAALRAATHARLPLRDPRLPILDFASRRTASTAAPPPSAAAHARSIPRPQRDLSSPDRGPTSREDTVTDFGALNVLGGTPAPSTSIDVCMSDGFLLDSGLRIADGDGLMLLGAEALVWRPWMSLDGSSAAQTHTQTDLLKKRDGVVSGAALRAHALRTARAQKRRPTEAERTGGIINAKGQFDLPARALGVLASIWPRPDLLMVGTGPRIVPLAPPTKAALQAMGFRLEVLDTRNAASQFNLLATERGVDEVGAIMVPIGFGEP